MIKTILFDLDGTLIDSTYAIIEGFKTSFDKFNLKYPGDELVKKQIGYPLDIISTNLGVRENIDDFIEIYKKRYGEIYLQTTTLLPNAKEAIELASSFATLGVVTTKVSKYSKLILQKHKVLNYFGTVIGRDNVDNPKPDKEPIIKALKDLDKTTKYAYMVGDTKMDMLSAKNANIKGIALACGYSDIDTLKAYTDLIFSDALEAVKFIKTMN
ncbi:MAG: HAD family hydrolase [Campylobacter sp.]|nr:HAD family hydrolase [Campylobacter sp.]